MNTSEPKQPHEEILIQRIPMRKIDIPPSQRKLGNLTGLVASIQRVRLRQPILVIRRGSRYQIIDGWRRYCAYKRLGWSAIPAIVLSVDDQVAELIAIDVHLMREELTPSERGDLRQQRKEIVKTIERQHENRNTPRQAQRTEQHKEGHSPTANTPSSIGSTPRPIWQLIGRFFGI
jgi:ParB family chromosome partitioning protein